MIMKKMLQVAVLAGLTISPNVYASFGKLDPNIGKNTTIEFEQNSKTNIVNNYVPRNFLNGKLNDDSIWYMVDKANPIKVVQDGLDDGYNFKQMLNTAYEVLEDKKLVNTRNQITKNELANTIQKPEFVSTVGTDGSRNAGAVSVYEVLGKSLVPAYDNATMKQNLINHITKLDGTYRKSYNDLVSNIAADDIADKIKRNNGHLVKYTPKQKREALKQYRLVAAAIMDNHIVEHSSPLMPNVAPQYHADAKHFLRGTMCSWLRGQGMIGNDAKTKKALSCDPKDNPTIKNYVDAGMDLKLYQRYAKRIDLYADKNLRKLDTNTFATKSAIINFN